MTNAPLPLHNAYWQSADYPGLWIQRYRGQYWDTIFYTPKHFQLGMIDAGQGEFIYKEQCEKVSTGDLFWIQPGQVHAGHPDPAPGWSVTVINFQPVLLARFAGELKLTLDTLVFPDTIKLAVSPATRQLCEAFQQLATQIIDPLSTLETDSLIYEVVGTLFSHSAQLPNDTETLDSFVQAVVAYLQTNFDRKVTLDELVAFCHVSKFHLLRTFKTAIGMPPHQYQMQLRLDEARKRLIRGEAVVDVAHALGFADQAHFINTFKKYAQYTPKRYQALLSNILQSFD
ncbi:MAG: AraC family transcriptional regulator [Caldilineaceae bacterium]